MHYFVFILVLQSRGSESWLLCYYCLTDVLFLYIYISSVALPHGAVDWSTVCDCGIL